MLPPLSLNDDNRARKVHVESQNDMSVRLKFSTHIHADPCNYQEFIVPGRDFELEDSDERRAFQTRFFQAWEEAVEGTSLEGFRPFGFDWRRLAQVVAKTRLELAYERYKIWFQKHETDTSSALGKRRRDDSVDSKTQEARFSLSKARCGYSWKI